MIGENTDGTSTTRATRGGGDANSSMATSMTSPTYASTIVTAATRGESFLGEEIPGTQSRSHSPLTVQSFQGGETEPQFSLAESVGTTVLSTAAVAAATRYISRPSSRPALSNRVVTFDVVMANQHAQSMNEAGDSITIPDELDNLSEVADTFAASSRVWREEYEARLDALQKRLSRMDDD